MPLENQELKGIEIREDDQLVHAGICKNGDSLVLVNSKNLIIRFEVNAKSIRTVSRTSIGVKGMTLDDGVKVIGSAVGLMQMVTYHVLQKMEW